VPVSDIAHLGGRRAAGPLDIADHRRELGWRAGDQADGGAGPGQADGEQPANTAPGPASAGGH
jgi:hypothetical protein